ncbi:MAG: chemotaxis protein CheA [Hyphomicrobium sp.]|uniref:chemotaxis protein CheA n=1 Tax=Hyphomicrobium sp. TaxID=82 RepID=UPI003D0F5412
MDELLSEFLSETADRLARLDLDLIRLEHAPEDPALLARIFRVLHTLKGTCGFVGLTRLERIAHAAEERLSRVRNGTEAPTPATVSLILQSLDRIRWILGALETAGVEPPGADDELVAELNEIPDEMPAMPAPEAGAGNPGIAVERSIRVDLDRLDRLMTLAGELILARNQALDLLKSDEDNPFAGQVKRLSQVASDLQDAVMKTRMQPIGQGWARFPRLVRDLARQLGKPIALDLRGGDTELDRELLELIKDPLAHMIRNAADHGLEPAEERRRAGKPETGTIRLEARHEGGMVVIEVADDGRGLPLAKIKARILEQGSATPAQIAAMSAPQLQRYILEPGFSTAATITRLSGRGVGLDVVRANIEMLGGTLRFESEEGQGTRFKLRVPLTLTILQTLVVASAGERFAVPQAATRELLQLQPGTAELVMREGRFTLACRGEMLPAVSLRRLLHLAGPAGPTAAEGHCAVLEVGALRFALLIDRALEISELLVKPVAPILRGIPIFSGATILGDGAVAMLLDPKGIAEMAGLSGASLAMVDPGPLRMRGVA